MSNCVVTLLDAPALMLARGPSKPMGEGTTQEVLGAMTSLALTRHTCQFTLSFRRSNLERVPAREELRVLAAVGTTAAQFDPDTLVQRLQPAARHTIH